MRICNHFGQMVTRPDFALCSFASPQRCNACFPEHNPRAFFLRELWIKRFLREVDCFVAPSHFLRERFISWGLPPDQIHVAENVLPEHPPPVSCRKRELGDALRVAFFGQLSPLKGIEVFLRAARKMDRADKAVEFRIYGSYESQPSSFQERVRAVLADLPVNVSFKGSYRNADVVRLMAQNDVVVVPSLWWENSPLVIREAEAAGCVVVGSDIGGVKEKIEALAAGRGYTFEVNDADDLTRCLSKLEAG